ncbi:EsaB/YukD family protein [Bacillus sp. CLL-7-23]|uniref:EsaB/YukD family protein n=1 Tax=Bacillus changyiensis TaxID=3004103 RepID=A0ABT4X8G1_9BACI|nr:EsaB/YukD family protein [Bacillus changyiensis]MDA7028034.1 EsaB/YukD family protein [Bacillus changyiensis]
MYVDITIDLKNYDGGVFDLRLSDYHSVKKVVGIAWQAQNISYPPREGYWVRVINKNSVFSGEYSLAECGITTGDRLEIL